MAGAGKKTTKKTIKQSKDIVESMVNNFKNKLLKLIEQGVTDLTIDAKGVKLIDSTGMGLLVAASNSLEQAGGQLSVINLEEHIYSLIQMMGIDKNLNAIAA